MCPWTTYIWFLCNIFMHPPASITPFVELSVDQSVVYWPGQFIVSSKHFNCTTSTPFFHRDDVFYLLYTRASMVSLLRNTQRRLWQLGCFVCLSVCVYVVNEITTPCLAKNALRAPSTQASVILVEFESTHTEGRLVVVGGLVACFEACVRISEDFPQKWPQSHFTSSHWSKFAPFFLSLRCLADLLRSLSEVGELLVPDCANSSSQDNKMSTQARKDSSVVIWVSLHPIPNSFLPRKASLVRMRSWINYNAQSSFSDCQRCWDV